MLHFFPEKLISLSTYLILPVSLLACKSLYDCYVKLSDEYENSKLFKKRHNCVVMFRDKLFTGWPPLGKRLKNSLTKNCFEELYEPFVYFINTAEYSLDIAFMLITVKPIFKALIDACDRGIKVKLLLNFSHCESSREELKALMKRGVDVLTYISEDTNADHIMHYKYMVKDFREDSGYAFMGSSNLTDSAFLNNYEDMVFTSSEEVVKPLHDNFQLCWDFVKAENQMLVNRVILSDADFI